MIRNALVRRYAIAAFRPQHLWVNISIYVIGLGLIGLFNGLAFRSGVAYEGSLRACFRAVYGQLLAIQLLLLWVWGGYSAGNALREEMLNKSYDFFQMLPLYPRQKLVGIAVGRNLLPLALASVTAVVQFLVGLAGEVPVFMQIQLLFLLVTTTTVVWNVCVLSSARVRKNKKQNRNVSIVLLIFFVFWLVPFVLQLIILASSVVKLEGWTVPFFGLEPPGMLLVGGIALYLAVWATLGAMRQFVRSDFPIFSAAGAYKFLIGCQIILLGLFWQRVPETASNAWYVYAIVTHVLAVLVPFGVMRSHEQYMELSYDLARKHGEGSLLNKSFFARTNLTVWCYIFVIWAAFTIGSAALVQSMESFRWALVLIVCVFLGWSVFMLLVELAVVGRPKNEKLKYFVGFVALLYLVVPMILAGVLRDTRIMAYSFFGIWGAVGERAFSESSEALPLVWPAFVNAVAVIVLFGLVRKRYLQILAARRAMSLPHS